MVKFLVGWNRKTEAKKAGFHRRLYIARYRFRTALATLACWLPLPLPLLLRLAGSDKQQPAGHHYGEVYAGLFRPFKYRRIRLLEIGIGGYGYSLGGQSLTAWQAYFPRATVIACDIEDKIALASRGTRIYRIDQSSDSDLEQLRQAEGPFEIIIDDGSHLNRHQIFTFRKLFGAVQPGGLYVIEDVMTSFWSWGGWDGAHIDRPDFENTCVGWFGRLSRYIYADEFESDAAVDPEMSALAAEIDWVRFGNNLIVVKRRLGPKGQIWIHPLKAAYERLAKG